MMPHSDDCAKYWYPLVPWVLPIDSEKLKKDEMYLQKCIHGFKQTNTKNKQNHVGIKHFTTNRIRINNSLITKISALSLARHKCVFRQHLLNQNQNIKPNII
jgi:hypothetical protein